MSESKIRSDAKLKTLPDERQDAIAEYALNHSGRETVAWLRSDGLVTSTGALSEFLSWYRLQRQFQGFEKSSLTMIELLRQKRPEMSQAELDGYASEFFQLQAIQGNDPKMWLAFATARTEADFEQRRIKIKQESLDLAREKFQRETCSLFLKWFEDKQARDVASSGATNADKIERLGQLMFGPDWGTGVPANGDPAEEIAPGQPIISSEAP